MSAEELYERAYAALREEGDAEEALRLYMAVVKQHPESAQAGYAKRQIKRIRSGEVKPGRGEREGNRTSDTNDESEQPPDDEVEPESPSVEVSDIHLVQVDQKYPAIRSLRRNLKQIAILTLVVGLLALFALATADELIFGLLAFGIAIPPVVIFWTLSEIVELFLGVEENTRRSSMMLQRIVQEQTANH